MSDDFIEPRGGFGRVWDSMYEGSLVGSGPEVFCLWPYVIAKMRVRNGEATVLLNPAFLAGVFGASDAEFVKRGIEKLCAEDPDSKNGLADKGRRLVKVSGHLYRVVNGAHYAAIRNKDKHAEAQARYRAKQKMARGARQARAVNDEREKRFVEADGNGQQSKADAIAAEGTVPRIIEQPLGDVDGPPAEEGDGGFVP